MNDSLVGGVCEKTWMETTLNDEFGVAQIVQQNHILSLYGDFDQKQRDVFIRYLLDVRDLKFAVIKDIGDFDMKHHIVHLNLSDLLKEGNVLFTGKCHIIDIDQNVPDTDDFIFNFFAQSYGLVTIGR